VVFASADSRADRLHAALSTTFEGFYGALGEASFERRVGHVRLLLPTVPLRIFNGVVVETEPCVGIADSIREVEEHGLPCGVQVRAGRHPEVEEEASRLGLTARESMPGMTVSPDELVVRPVPNLEIAAVRDEQGLREAAGVGAAGFDAPSDAMLALYPPGVLELAGFTVYLGRIDGDAVTTAMGYQTDRDVAIFSVATNPSHRRNGYGAAITAQAARDGFANGSDLAWLQTSEMGESVYRGLGFGHVAMHLMLHRPSAPTA
jgi:ribosomal protein S18 acetylase RimI-like enzyme